MAGDREYGFRTMSDVLFGFYGDDFTGSTDAMDALVRAGVKTVLFVEEPTEQIVEDRFPTVDAVGVAGTSRSMTPAEMGGTLPDQFAALKRLNPTLVHYKVCSTFDSAPDIGSIGRATEIGMEVFDTQTVPLIPAAPALERYVVFGNMFAKNEDEVFRLDRHPTMQNHPVTPMTEGDLTRHLAGQTNEEIALVDIRAVQSGVSSIREQYDESTDESAVVLFDALSDDDMERVGRFVWEEYVDSTGPSFVVGSSGVESALAAHWQSTSIIPSEPKTPSLEPADQVLVVSGSASPVTDAQIQCAIDVGFTDIRIHTSDLVDPETVGDERKRVVDEIRGALADGENVLAYTARGPDDNAINRTRQRAAALDNPVEDVGRVIAAQQGVITANVLRETAPDRVCIAGGDTCGHVTPKLSAVALEIVAPIDPGAPLCRLHAETAPFDGLEVALKGGQLGAEEYFATLARGT